jgi:hypothetical protein
MVRYILQKAPDLQFGILFESALEDATKNRFQDVKRVLL